ncbi:MAG: hypothetical protein RI894_780 [Bacteroidota bacterium]|jgi:hypothetical protein
MENLDFVIEQPGFITQLFIIPTSDIELSEDKKKQGSDNPKALICVFKERQTQTDYTFLIRILQAVDLQLDTNCNLYECEKNTHLSLQYSYQEKPVEIVLFFGISPKNAGLQNDWKKYRPYLLNHTYFLHIDSLGTIENDANLKKKLWECLKFVFKK